MNTFDQLLEKHYPKKASYLQLLMEMVEKEMDNFEPKNKEVLKERLGQALTWDSIPEIPISEIGWSKLDTEGSQPVASEQRTQLEQFLSKIAGNNIQEKIVSLNKFYSMDDEMTAGLMGDNSTENISKAISYLVFYKTLTQIITHFNASSAGFSFESFLAVLLGGKQIQTGEGTIADLTDAQGTPISLKLYKEGNLEVGGSFTDLAVDLAKDGIGNKMQYVCVTKTLSGPDLEQEGRLDWYLFQFTLENVYNILAGSSKKSRRNILLPITFMESQGEKIEGLPSKALALPSPRELEQVFKQNLNDLVQADLEAVSAELEAKLSLTDLFQAIDFAHNENLFTKTGGKIPGKSPMAVGELARVLTPLYGGDKGKVKGSLLFQYIKAANEKLIASYKKGGEQEELRSQQIGDLYFYGDLSDDERFDRSRAFYNAASPELKKRCLMASLGYVSSGHFNLTQTMVQKVAQLAGEQAGELFPSGQSEVGLGSIEIGASKIQSVLNKISEVLNENIFDIFSNLKVLTTNLQGFFAGGLTDDAQATTAITAADSIEKKTEKIRPGK